jgi:hypothetical protein
LYPRLTVGALEGGGEAEGTAKGVKIEGGRVLGVSEKGVSGGEVGIYITR